MEITSHSFPPYVLFLFCKDEALLHLDVTMLWEPLICESGSGCPNKDMNIFK